MQDALHRTLTVAVSPDKSSEPHNLEEALNLTLEKMSDSNFDPGELLLGTPSPSGIDSLLSPVIERFEEIIDGLDEGEANRIRTAINELKDNKSSQISALLRELYRESREDDS